MRKIQGHLKMNSVRYKFYDLYNIGYIWDTCSWKGPLKKKREVGQFELRKFPFKLESTNRSWKVFQLRLKNFISSARTFQLLVFPTPFLTTCILFAVLAAESSGAFQVRLIDDRDPRAITGRPEKILKI